jgi:hypothetical protein
MSVDRPILRIGRYRWVICGLLLIVLIHFLSPKLTRVTEEAVRGNKP